VNSQLQDDAADYRLFTLMFLFLGIFRPIAIVKRLALSRCLHYSSFDGEFAQSAKGSFILSCRTPPSNWS
jgi:hypothetical protein